MSTTIDNIILAIISMTVHTIAGSLSTRVRSECGIWNDPRADGRTGPVRAVVRPGVTDRLGPHNT